LLDPHLAQEGIHIIGLKLTVIVTMPGLYVTTLEAIFVIGFKL
jgi:hypothetical protein